MNLHLACYRPKSLPEVSRILKESPHARIVAGGTDLLVKLRNGMIPETTGLVDINLLNLAFITEDEENVVIGARCTMSQIVHHPRVKELFPALVAAANTVGAPQIRNAATLGGNVGNASPAGDTIPALVSLDAIVVLFGAEDRRRVPLAEFFTGPGKTVMKPDELIEAFEIPAVPSRGVFMKLGERRAHAISKINLAMSVRQDTTPGTVRIAMGSVAPTVIRVPEAEKILSEADFPWKEAIVNQAAAKAKAAAKPISDIRSQKFYRKKMAEVLLKRACEQILSD